MKYKYTTSVIKSNSSLRKNERNDCVVRAFCAALDCVYDSAHEFVKEVFKRKDKEGVKGMVYTAIHTQNTQFEIDGHKFSYDYLDNDVVCNYYRVNGESIRRKKTVKSFMKDYNKGVYIVLVSGHAFCVKDGVLMDNPGEEWRPTRKVEGALELKIVDPQLEFKFA